MLIISSRFIVLLWSIIHFLIVYLLNPWGFPDSSVDTESACNAGDPSSIPGLGWSTGEGKGYRLQYSWASLVPQLVKNPPAMWETWVRSLVWEDPLEKGKATHSSIPAWRIPWAVESTEVSKSRTRLSNFHYTHYIICQLLKGAEVSNYSHGSISSFNSLSFASCILMFCCYIVVSPCRIDPFITEIPFISLIVFLVLGLFMVWR